MRFAYMALLFLDLEETFYNRLSMYQRRLRDKRIPRCALRFFNDSAWLHMFMSGNDQALLNMTGVTHQAFRLLLDVFDPYWDAYVVDREGNIRVRKKTKRGRPRIISSLGGLGLVLTWYRTKGARSRNLVMQFGLTSTPMVCWLWFGMCCLKAALINHPTARICTPTPEEVEIYKNAISAKYPALKHVWAAIDGCKLRVAEAQNWREQLTYYNGWQHSHYVNNIFLFSPDGRIRICVLNCPGSWHDSVMSEHGAYQKMRAIYEETGGQVVVDSAFKIMQGSDGNNMFIKSSQQDPDGTENIVVNRQATSVRQLSEWGMRMVQGQFPRLKDVLPLEQNKRQTIIHLAVLIYNFTTSEVGINQILNTYMNADEGDFFGQRLEPWNNL